MLTGGALLTAAVACVLLVLSGLWADARFARFAKLPAHFDWHGRATWFAPRRFVVWLTPAIFVALIALILFLVNTLPPDQIKGSPDQAVIVTSLIILGAQGFILWLMARWARGQG